VIVEKKPKRGGNRRFLGDGHHKPKGLTILFPISLRTIPDVYSD